MTQDEVTEYYRQRGFDLTAPWGKRTARVRCSQCEMLAINGVATHETGCANLLNEETEK